MVQEFLAKSEENLRAADALFELGLYNAAANRAYYAAFHAAIAILAQHGITNQDNAHEWVQAQFASELIHRRKVLPANLLRGLQDIQRLRNIADYDATSVSKTTVERHIRKAHDFCTTITQRGER